MKYCCEKLSEPLWSQALLSVTIRPLIPEYLISFHVTELYPGSVLSGSLFYSHLYLVKKNLSMFK